MEALMGCMEKECKLEDLTDVMPGIILILKDIDNGKPMCALMRTFAPEGPMAEALKELDDEDIIKMMKSLNEGEMKMLLNLGKGPLKLGALIQLGPKLLNVFKGMKGGKGVQKLIAIVTSQLMGGGRGGGGGGAGLMNLLGNMFGAGGLLGGFGGAGGGGGRAGRPNPFASGAGGGGGGAGFTNPLGRRGGGDRRSGRRPSKQGGWNFGDGGRNHDKQSSRRYKTSL
ncbi:uncharacterized protein M6D78_013259 isoform 2-T2 [Vipera latastei]